MTNLRYDIRTRQAGRSRSKRRRRRSGSGCLGKLFFLVVLAAIIVGGVYWYLGKNQDVSFKKFLDKLPFKPKATEEVVSNLINDETPLEETSEETDVSADDSLAKAIENNAITVVDQQEEEHEDEVALLEKNKKEADAKVNDTGDSTTAISEESAQKTIELKLEDATMPEESQVDASPVSDSQSDLASEEDETDDEAQEETSVRQAAATKPVLAEKQV